MLLAFWRPKILRGFAVSALLVGGVSVALARFAGSRVYTLMMTHMASESTSSTNNKYSMDPRAMPNLRGLIYAIASIGRDSIGSGLARAVLIAIAIASLAILVVSAIIFKNTVKNSRATADLAFATALAVALAVSFHLEMHDLTLFAMAFALIINRGLERPPFASARFRAQIVLMVPFFMMPLALVLVRAHVLYLFGLPVASLAILDLMDLHGLANRKPQVQFQT